MSNFRKSITKSVLSEFGRFPNPETSIRLDLGQIGTYDGWDCQFNWRHKLEDLEISVAAPKKENIPGFVDEIFSIGDQTKILFTGDANGKASATMSFGRARSLIAQATSMVCLSLDQTQLRRAIIDAIQKGKIWDHDWVVLTHVFFAGSYSQFFASSKNADLTVSAKVDASIGSFNLADKSLGLGISSQSGAVHNILAKDNVTPFFLVQKVKGWRREFRIKPDWSEENLVLTPYG